MMRNERNVQCIYIIKWKKNEKKKKIVEQKIDCMTFQIIIQYTVEQ